MNSLPKYLREEAVRALNRAAKLTESTFPSDARYFEQTAARIAPIKRLKTPMQKARERGEKTARQERNANTGDIRAACLERAGGFCECGCGQALIEGHFKFKPEMDEWENGNGRRQQNKAVSTCWILASICHVYRQQYIPDVKTWNERRRFHDEKHGYPHHPHVEHVEPARKSARTA